MMRRFIWAFTVLLFCTTSTLFAQKTKIYTYNDADFKTGIELFQKEKYSAAQKYFEKTLATHPDDKSAIHTDAQFYAAVCAIELFNKNSEHLLKTFIADHPENNKIKQAHFHLGKYYYRKKSYDKSIEHFEKVENYELTQDEQSELYFKRGYSYFEKEQTDRAKKDFYEIKDVDTRYTSPANYYYSHIAYNEKNYQTALEGFLRLQQNESFGSVVPYYITQIYFLQEKYDSVISYAPALLDSAVPQRAHEIARIIGESYYQMQKYKEAIPYFKKYETLAKILTRDDKYQLGYSYYKTDDYDKAIIYFIFATEYNDSTAQSAFYHLGDCYLKKNNKLAARSAFRSASKLAYDKMIQEDALFTYAKLCYELSFNPYGEAISALQEYINKYPLSPRIDEAYGYLVVIFMTTRNYADALTAIESIRLLNPELKNVYQRIAFNRGIELYNNQLFDSAIVHFNKAQKYQSDKKLNAMSYYWKGESNYRKKSYNEAITNYQQFMFEKGAFDLPEFDLGNYNIGYCKFMLKNYDAAMIDFRKFVATKEPQDPEKINDAYNRIGDCFLMKKDYENAIDYYAEAIKIKKTDVDYSLYQQSMAYGVTKKFDKKAAALNSLVTEHPQSPNIAAAKYELGRTYMNLNELDKAQSYFQSVIRDHPNSNYVRKALVNGALVHYNKNEDDLAITDYKKVVTDYVNTPEAHEAIEGLRKIYTEKGDLDPFVQFVAGRPFANVSKASLDSGTFEIAKKKYYDGDCAKAIESFTKYIEKFYPDGIFILDANYLRAECQQQQKLADNALNGYKYIIEQPKNIYTEPSLANAAYIAFNKKDYTAANDYYVKLEASAENQKNLFDAKLGQMRCNYQFKNYVATTKYAQAVLASEKVPANIQEEAHITLARTAFESGNMDQALSEYRATANMAKSEISAEAKYGIAYIQYTKGEYAESKKSVFELVKQSPSYPYWITKTLILLADNYLALGDNFQAKTTLKSVIEDSDIAELITIAQTKYDKILESEKPKTDSLPSNELKVEFKEQNLNDNIFKDEPK